MSFWSLQMQKKKEAQEVEIQVYSFTENEYE